MHYGKLDVLGNQKFEYKNIRKDWIEWTKREQLFDFTWIGWGAALDKNKKGIPP